jgi:hypothetical protein
MKAAEELAVGRQPRSEREEKRKNLNVDAVDK